MAECIKMRIEVPFSLLIFALTFADSITTNWIMYRTCYVTLGFNRSECVLLGSKHPDNSTASLEEKVQPYATIISMTKLLTEAFFTSVVCFFIGPWSDKYGRKPVFLLTLGGYVLSYLLLAVISALPNLSPWYTLLSSLPLYFSGGFMPAFAALLCYITDITTPQNRGLRIAIFYAIVTGGELLGTLSSSYALKVLGYFIMYLTSAMCIFLAWLIIYLFVPESVANVETEGKIRNLFKLSLVQETVKTTFRKRNNYDRLMLFTIIVLLVIYLLAYTGDNMNFMYLREKFHWSLQKYTMYSGINTVTSVIGSVAGIYCLHKLIGVDEAIVVIIGFISLLSGAVFRGLATKDWQIYAGGVSKCFGGTVSPMARSLVSKIVPSDEYGKIFAFLAICESIISPLGSPLYTFIYNNTISTFPGAFNLVTAGIYLIAILLAIGMAFMQKSQDRIPYDSLNTDISAN